MCFPRLKSALEGGEFSDHQKIGKSITIIFFGADRAVSAGARKVCVLQVAER